MCAPDDHPSCSAVQTALIYRSERLHRSDLPIPSYAYPYTQVHWWKTCTYAYVACVRMQVHICRSIPHAGPTSKLALASLPTAAASVSPAAMHRHVCPQQVQPCCLSFVSSRTIRSLQIPPLRHRAPKPPVLLAGRHSFTFGSDCPPRRTPAWQGHAACLQVLATARGHCNPGSGYSGQL